MRQLFPTLMVVSVSTINEENLNTFDDAANAWWSNDGPFKLLHTMNPIRLSYIHALMVSHFKTVVSPSPKFQNLNILDIGCGGGIVCEPFARLGANVTGIDASVAAINVAKNHAQTQNLAINYINTPIENFDTKEKFDVITVLEILEHVDQLEFFIENVVQHLSPNGLLFFSTINRNYRSYLGAILAAEHILRWVPQGTHDWSKFIKPSELTKMLRDHNLQVRSLKGLRLKPLSQTWEISSSPAINYIGCASFG